MSLVTPFIVSVQANKLATWKFTKIVRLAAKNSAQVSLGTVTTKALPVPVVVSGLSIPSFDTLIFVPIFEIYLEINYDSNKNHSQYHSLPAQVQYADTVYVIQFETKETSVNSVPVVTLHNTGHHTVSVVIFTSQCLEQLFICNVVQST
jgi:hypothetical protein